MKSGKYLDKDEKERFPYQVRHNIGFHRNADKSSCSVKPGVMKEY